MPAPMKDRMQHTGSFVFKILRPGENFHMMLVQPTMQTVKHKILCFEHVADSYYE